MAAAALVSAVLPTQTLKNDAELTTPITSLPPSSGPTSAMESSSISSTPTSSAPSILYQDQAAPPTLMHMPYEAPPPPTYLPSTPPLPVHPHPTHLTHHSSYHPCLPPSSHWGALQMGGPGPRLYCPAPNPTHMVGYITAPPTHHTATHYMPPTI